MLPVEFRDAFLSGDADAIKVALADGVTFSSPVVHKPYGGRAAVVPILLAARRTFEDFDYVDHVGERSRHVLFFRARVGDKALEGIDAIRLDSEGRVAELVVMIRPLSAVQAVAEAMAGELERPTP
jgi:hypothetical protein